MLIDKPAVSIENIDERFAVAERIYCFLNGDPISQGQIGDWRRKAHLAPLGVGSQMATFGYTVLGFGLLVWLYGEIRFLVVAYNRNLWWFFGCLFVPLVSWIFLFTNWKETNKPFILVTIGFLVTGLGAWMAGVVVPD